MSVMKGLIFALVLGLEDSIMCVKERTNINSWMFHGESILSNVFGKVASMVNNMDLWKESDVGNRVFNEEFRLPGCHFHFQWGSLH